MSATRVERLLNLLTLLLNSRRPISLREIRELDEFAAYQTDDPKSGERAFERDKAALIELGVPLRWVQPESDDNDDGDGGYLIDREKYYLPDLGLQPQELAQLSIAGAAAAAIEGFPGRDAVVRALAKLGFDADSEGHSALMAHVPIVHPNTPQILEHLQVLHDAVDKKKRIRLNYQNLHSQSTKREVDPYGLYYRRGMWYLVGYCHLRKSERTFHVGRIAELMVLRPDTENQDFTIPAGFELAPYVSRQPWEYAYEEPYDVELRLEDKFVPAAREIFGSTARLSYMKDGAHITLQVSNTSAFVAAILPIGAGVEVLSPAKLRHAMADMYAQLVEQYQRVSSTHPKRSRGRS